MDGMTIYFFDLSSLEQYSLYLCVYLCEFGAM